MKVDSGDGGGEGEPANCPWTQMNDDGTYHPGRGLKCVRPGSTGVQARHAMGTMGRPAHDACVWGARIAGVAQ